MQSASLRRLGRPLFYELLSLSHGQYRVLRIIGAFVFQDDLVWLSVTSGQNDTSTHSYHSISPSLLSKLRTSETEQGSAIIYQTRLLEPGFDYLRPLFGWCCQSHPNSSPVAGSQTLKGGA
jgi:hypothetical protein